MSGNRITRFVGFTLALVHIGLPEPALADGLAFVANRDSDDVSVVDLGNASDPPRVLLTIPVVDRPEDIVFSADGSRVYVPNDKDLSIIDVRSLAVRHIRFPNGADDASSAVEHPDGRRVYVSHDNTGYISLVDTVTGRVDFINVPVMDVNMLAISDDGQFVYGVGNGSGDVFQLEVASNTAIRIFEGAAPLPKGIRSEGLGADVAISSDYNLELVGFSVSGFGMVSALYPSSTGGVRPGRLAPGLSGGELVTLPFDDQAVNLNFPTPTYFVVPGGSDPADAAASDAFSRVAVANAHDPNGGGPSNQGSVSVFDDAGNELATLSGGLDPRAIQIAPRRGVELRFNPISTAFPLSPRNSGNPIVRTTEIRNVGDVTTSIRSLSIVGPDATGFRILQEDCSGRKLAYQESCTAEVQFTAFPKNNPFPGIVKYYIPSYGAGLYVDASGVDESGATGSLRAGYFLGDTKMELKEEFQLQVQQGPTLIWGD